MHKCPDRAISTLVMVAQLSEAVETDNSKEIPTGIGETHEEHKYARQPLFWRSFAYFCYRYFLKGACLNGKTGFIWTFLQGWWYRTLVDAKVFEIKRACGTDKAKIIRQLKEEYNIELSQKLITVNGGG